MNISSVLQKTGNLFFRLNGSGNSAPIGLHCFDRNTKETKCRVHLRIDPDGTGTLLINAAQLIHLNSSAAMMAFHYLSGKTEMQAASHLSRVYQLPSETVMSEYREFIPKIESMVNQSGECPVCEYGFETEAPFSTRPTSPYRMDLALTYRCNNNCAHCYNARPRNFPELSTVEWKKVIRRCWDIGIPHIIFTGGEPTLRDDLPELIAYGESLGQITGLNTNGRRLSEKGFIQSLIDAGLDHVQITFESADPEIHDHLVCHAGAWNETIKGIQNSVESSLYLMTNTTLLKENAPTLQKTLSLLKKMNVPTVGLNALIYSGKGVKVGTGLSESDLPPLLQMAKDMTDTGQQKLIWYTPTQYCHFDPMTLQLGIKGCTAALYNMCVEPDGSVLPCQSYYQPVGNILNDDWDAIWNHKISVSLRERKDVPIECMQCSMLLECGGGCPLHRLENRPIPFLDEIIH
jgi:radical SAM protein with 4Fe4S-binding SPASM domain